MFSALGIATGAGRFLLANPILLALVGIVVAYQGGYWLGSRDGRAVASVEFQRQVAKLNSEADARVLEAIKAAEALDPTPSAPAELARLCDKDRACRRAR